MGVAGIGLHRSWVDVCMCSSCVLVKGAVSVRPSVTSTHTLPHRRMCGQLYRMQCLVILGFLVEAGEVEESPT